MTFDAENRLTAVTGGSTSASFVYAADGSRTVGAVNGVTTVYIGGIYEWQAGAATAYYAGPDGAVAFRRSGYATDNGVFYLLRDHLGSSVIVDGSGAVVKREFYYPFGGNRGGAFSDLTRKRFTGQYHEQDLPGGEGLSYYNARWYDAQLGRFVSADTIVPEPVKPQSLNRYAYTFNNPLVYTDPDGHDPWWLQEPWYDKPDQNLAPVDSFGTNRQQKRVARETERAFRALRDKPFPIQVRQGPDGRPEISINQALVRRNFEHALGACGRAINGVCGISAGISKNAYGGGGRGSADIFFDGEGSFNIYVTGGGGGYTPLPGPDVRYNVIGIPNVSLQDLDGASAQFGLSAALGGYGGSSEAVFLRRDDGEYIKGTSYGLATSVVPAPTGEIHLTMTYSELVYSIDIQKKIRDIVESS